MAKSTLDKQLDRFRKECDRVQKGWNWRRLRFFFEWDQLRMFYEQWQRQRMRKHISWVLGTNDFAPRESDNLPPTPREQLEHLKQWHSEHVPPVTEGAHLATRWQDDQVLKINIPLGCTRQQKKQIAEAISGFLALCNMKVIGDPPPKFGDDSVE